MHIMATNLAVWISVIADETSHALHPKQYNESARIDCFKNYTALKESMDIYCTNISTIAQYLSIPSFDPFEGK